MTNPITIVIDIDGTICPIKKPDEEYQELKPHTRVIERIRWYKEMGAKIILYTSRNMRTYKGDAEKIQEKTVPLLKEWLTKWKIPYDELVIGKPWADRGFYVDDKAIRPNEFLTKDLDEIRKIIGDN